MKLLIVVRSQNRAKTFANTTLKYIARSGYNYSIYLKKKDEYWYRNSLDSAESDHYLYLPEENIIVNRVNDIYSQNLLRKIKKEAANDYHLLVEIPDVIKVEGKTTDDKVLNFFKEIAKMRSQFEEGRTFKLKSEVLEGATMYRL